MRLIHIEAEREEYQTNVFYYTVLSSRLEGVWGMVVGGCAEVRLVWLVLDSTSNIAFALSR